MVKILEAVPRGTELTQTGHVVTHLYARRLDGIIYLLKTDVGHRVTCLNFKIPGVVDTHLSLWPTPTDLWKHVSYRRSFLFPSFSDTYPLSESGGRVIPVT